MVGGGEEEVLSTILLLTTAAGFAHTATLLVAEGVQSLAFNIALMANGNHNILFGNQVLHIHFRGIKGNFRTTLIAELLLHFQQILFNNIHDLMLIS